MLTRLVKASLLGAAALIAVTAAPSGAAAHHHQRVHSHAQSNPDLDLGKSKHSANWAGYVATGAKFSSVASSWTVPAVDCSVVPNGASAAWVGLDGSGSHTVEQTGTLSDCDKGTPSYAAWFEVFPQPLSRVANPVSAGDAMSASVVFSGSTFTLTISDNSQGWTATSNSTKKARRASAEVVAEAPSSGGQVLPLADFGSVNFSGATVNGQPLSASSPGQVTMTTFGGIVKAQPGPLSGGNFTVSWQHA